MSVLIQKKYIIGAGLPRSGGVSLMGTLDGHPQVVVWPTEFQYFRFFQAHSKQGLARIGELNQALFQNEFPKNYYSRLKLSGPVPEIQDFSTDFFRGDFFHQEMEQNPDALVDQWQYLDRMHRALVKADSRYSSIEETLFAIGPTARGIDWNDDELFRFSHVIFLYRDPFESYLSLREKYLKRIALNSHLAFRAKKDLLFWAGVFQQIQNEAKIRVNSEEAIPVPLSDLQKFQLTAIESLVKKIGLKPHSSLERLTQLGVPFQGNAVEEKNNCGTFAPRTSRLRFPGSAFEKLFFLPIDFNVSPSQRPSQSWGLVTRLAWKASFQNYRKHLKIHQRFTVFFSLLLKYFLWVGPEKLRSAFMKRQNPGLLCFDLNRRLFGQDASVEATLVPPRT